MNWADILGTISGGGVFGLAGAIAKGWLEIKQQKARMEEKRLDAEIQRELIKVQLEKGIAEGELKAFAASQEGGRAESDSFAEIAKLAVTPLQRWMVLLAASGRFSTRFLLTWAVHAMSFVIFFHVTEDMQRAMLLQVLGMAGTYGGWFFGSRVVLGRSGGR